MKQSEKWKHGLPYVGNKGQKAEKIIDILPAGNRLVDVFGGGGSISLTAASSGKWNAVVYNDRRKTVVNLLKALIEDNPHFDLMKYVYMDRETFYKWRDNMPDSLERTLVLTIWSFSNGWKSYLWGKRYEKEKLQLTRALFWGNTGTKLDDLYSYSKNETSIAGKYSMFHKWRLEKMNIRSDIDNDQLANILRINRIEQLQQLQQLNSIEYSTLDYRLLNIRKDDIVYCDPPYLGTSADYGGFDNDSFQWWLANCPARQIYISEYTKLPHTEVVFSFEKKRAFTISGKYREELLLKYVKE